MVNLLEIPPVYIYHNGITAIGGFCGLKNLQPLTECVYISAILSKVRANRLSHKTYNDNTIHPMCMAHIVPLQLDVWHATSLTSLQRIFESPWKYQ